MPILELKNLSKSFDSLAVDDVSLNVKTGEILCLLGPSGCGKTTLLRMVAGLEKPDRGQVIFDNQDMTNVAPQQRNFGLMFQEYALFPHKNVFENVAFGLRMHQQSPQSVQERTNEMLDFMGISELSTRNVANLSGGERQRVALARALAPQPRLLMLDEPLGALDRALRERLLVEIRTILKDLNMTALFVTHDQSEALAMSDRVAVMNHGRLEQVDGPEALYLYPKTKFVAGFLGFQNLISGMLNDAGAVETKLGIFQPNGITSSIPGPVTLIIRPEGARLLQTDHDSVASHVIKGKIVSRVFTGQCYRVKLAVDDETILVFDLSNDKVPPTVGQKVRLGLDPSCLVMIHKGAS